ncbi:MAG: hypothetical protein ACYCU7_00015 [Acidimicrobiales bacterium]
MSVTRLAVVLGVVAFGVLCWAAAAGVEAAYELLVSLVVLVALVAGGNWLGGRRTPDVEPYRPLPGADPAAAERPAATPAGTGGEPDPPTP